MRIESIHFRRWIETGLEWNVVGRGLRHVSDRSPVMRKKLTRRITGFIFLTPWKMLVLLLFMLKLATSQDTAKRDTEERMLETG